jgi:hypothetical protein
VTWIATALGWAFSICLFSFIFVGVFLWAARSGKADNGERSDEYASPQRYGS